MLRRLSPVIRSAPVLEAISWAYAERPRSLLYHRFGERSSPRHLGIELFEAEVKLISERFTPMTVSGLLEAMATGRRLRKAVVVTIDDGYEDVYRYAFPILRYYGVPATLYVTAGFLDRALWLWPDAIAHVLETTVLQEYRSPDVRRTLPLGTPAERDEAWRVLATHGESLPATTLQTWIAALATGLGVTLGPTPADSYRPMSWGQLREMAEAGIEIGDHSWSHPLLTNCDETELQCEIRRSKARTEEQLGRPVTSFAYPHGAFDAAVRRTVEAAGFTSAVALETRSSAIDAFAIPRLSCGTTFDEFRDSLYGVRFLASRFGLSI